MNAPLIQIGGHFEKDSTKNLGDLISRIFESAAKNRMEQETVRAALAIISKGLTADASINNCTLTGEKSM